jgi:hypothetical protein
LGLSVAVAASPYITWKRIVAAGKNHKKVLGLCWEHHLGREGIDGKIMTRPEWVAKFGTEQELFRKQERILHAKG